MREVVRAESSGGVVEAVVLDVEGEGRVQLRLADGPTVLARLASFGPYRPVAGDRVLVTAHPHYVIGALHVAQAAAFRTADGAAAELHDDAIEVRDPQGRLLFRYEHGQATLLSEQGDLVLCAPEGTVRLEAGQDLELAAGRDLVARPARRSVTEIGNRPRVTVDARATRFQSDHFDVEAKQSTVTVGEATIIAQGIATTAAHVIARVERYELEADRIVEKSRDVLRTCRELLETRAGRMRTRVKGAFSLSSRRTDLASEKDTTIDGKRVLLG